MPDKLELLEDDDEDKQNAYTDQQKQRDILLSNFQNIARYMDTEMHDNDNKLVLKNLADIIIDDYDLSKINEDRFNFYMELQKILRKDPRIFNIIMNLNTRIKIKKKKERKLLNQLVKVLKDNKYKPSDGKIDKNTIVTSLENMLKQKYNFIGSQNNDNEFKADELYKYLRNKQSGGDYEKQMKELIQKELGEVPEASEAPEASETSETLKTSIINKASKLYKNIKGNNEANKEDELRGNLALHYGMNNLENLTQNILNITDDDKFKKRKTGIEEFVDDYYQAHSASTSDDISKKLQAALDKFEASPVNFLENIKITKEDRLIFIFVTFFIRYITILMVQWCIDINIVKDFYQGFLLYAFIYLIIFWFIVMLININNLTPISYMNIETNIGGLQSMFYYFYMGTNGIARLLTHSFLIILLLLIPILLNINHKNLDDIDTPIDGTGLSYEDRKKLTKTLSLFTIFIWMLTSIISIKY